MSTKLTYSPKRKQTVPTEQAARETEICVAIINNLYAIVDEERAARATAEAAAAAAAAKARAAKNRLRRAQRKTSVLRHALDAEADRTEAAHDGYRDLYYRHERVVEDHDTLVIRCEEREREIAELREQLHRVRRGEPAIPFWGGEGAGAAAIVHSPIARDRLDRVEPLSASAGGSFDDEETVILSPRMNSSYPGWDTEYVEDFPGIADAFYGR